VEIYEIANDSSLILKWMETTSSGDELDQTGRFSSHYEELNDSSFIFIKLAVVRTVHEEKHIFFGFYFVMEMGFYDN